MPGRAARRFRAFCVGLPKTGTTSVGTIFESYRSAKIAGSALERVGCDVRDDAGGSGAAVAARAFVHQRDEEECLEMDPSSANWMVLGILKQEFPDARFILTIRDCYSWCDSMLNVLVGREIGTDFLERPDLFRRVLGCELEWFRDAETVIQHREPIFDRLLRFWSEQIKTARECPPSRTLILRTNEISSSLDVLASFVGVPRDTLLPERTHSRQAPKKFNIMQRLDRDFLDDAFAGCADTPFMREYFPASTLPGFLSSAARPPSRRSEAAAPTKIEEAVPHTIAGASGHAEITQALLAIRSAGAIARRLGYRLRKDALRVRNASCYALLAFAGPRGTFVLELGLRGAEEGHWLASERFAVSYRRSNLGLVQSDLRLAETLLEIVERQVERADAEGRTHGRQ